MILGMVNIFSFMKSSVSYFPEIKYHLFLMIYFRKNVLYDSHYYQELN